MDNIYPDLSNDKFDIQYARLLGLSSDLAASIVTGETGPDPVIKTPSDDDTGLMRFGVAAEDHTAGENRSFNLAGEFSFAITQLGNPVFLVDPSNGLYQLGAVPVPGSDSGLSYTYLEVDDTDQKITLQAPQGIIATGYGYGNHSGTAAFNLAVDAGGNIIEVATGGGGSGTVNSGLLYKAAYYITNPSGTVIDDWVGVEFGKSGINTEIIQQATNEIALKISLITSSAEDAIRIVNSGGTSIFSVGETAETLIGTNSNSDPIAGTSFFKVVHGTQVLSFTNAGSTNGWLAVSNGTVTGFVGHTNTASGGFILGSYTGHALTFRTNNTNVASFNTTGDLFIGNPGFASAARRLQVLNNDTNGAVVTYLARLTHTTSSTPATGIGAGIEFEVETSANNNEIGATLEFITTDVAGGSEDFDMVVNLMAGGATAAEKLRVISTGELKVQLLNQDDTESKVVVWNSTDKILEWRDASTLGGGISGITADMGITASTSTNVQLGSANTSGVPLTEDRYINTGAFQLIAQGANGNNSGSDMGIMQINNTSTGIALYAATYVSGGTPIVADANGTTTNNIETALRLNRAGTLSATDGYGCELRYTINTSSVNQSFASRIATVWTNATNGAQTSKFIHSLVTDADSHDVLIMSGAQSWLLARDAGTNQTAERYSVIGTYKTLTESSATPFVRINIPSGTVTGGEIIITVEANDATDYQSRTLRFIWSAVNKVGTITATVQTPEEAVAVSTGTLTVTIDTNDAGSGNLDFRANAVSSLTQTTLRCSYQVFKNIGTGAITPQ